MLFPAAVYGQDYSLEFTGNEEDLGVVKAYRIEKQDGDSLSLISQLDHLHHSIRKDGYLQSELTTQWLGKHLLVKIDLGDRYHWLKLAVGNVDPRLLQRTGYRDKFFSNQPFRYQEAEMLMRQLIDISANSGFPFASVKLDSVQVLQKTVKASLNYHPGPQITFDTLVLINPVRINTRFLQAYLKIPVGTLFSQALIDQLPSRIEKLPYLKLMDQPLLTFQNDQASLHLALESVRSNQIDGVIGFLPNARSDGELLLTGQLNLLLQNMFGAGRILGFQWESFKPESQQLNIRFLQPMLLKSPIDVDLEFNLFKEDSTFINKLFHVDMEYPYGKNHYFGLNTYLKSSRLPSAVIAEPISGLPDLADFNLNQFGGSYRYYHLDSYYQPMSGLKLDLRAYTGMKKIRKNSAVSDTLYTDVDLQSSQFSWEAELEGYYPLSKHWVISGKWKGAGVYNERLFYNDLYRLGGLKSIRGFSENTFFADNFAYSTIEPRFFFETNSYLFVFYDQAWWLRYDLENNSFKDTPWGMGAGISLTTKAGIFSFIWATGKSKSQEVGFNQSKIHFGYISRF